MSIKTQASGPAVSLAVRRSGPGERAKRSFELATRGVIYLFVILIALLSVFPFIWMFSTSFKDTITNMEYPPRLIPPEPTLINYRDLFLKFDYFLWLRNSAVVTGFVLVLGPLFNSMAGYVFAKKDFLFKNVLFVIILGTLIVPEQITIVPLFIIFSELKLVNTFQALIFPYLAGGFGVFLMRQYMTTIPDDLIDAARIDGSGEFRIFWQIMVPLSKPALAALGVFTFLGSWNNFLLPLIVTTESSMRTLPVGLAVMDGEYEFQTRWGLIMAGGTVMFAPAFMVYVAFQRYFVQGIALTGLKG